MDKRIKAKSKVNDMLGIQGGDDNTVESPEVDRRLELLRRTRKEIEEEEERKKSEDEHRKQEEVEKRIKKLEEIK